MKALEYIKDVFHDTSKPEFLNDVQTDLPRLRDEYTKIFNLKLIAVYQKI